MRDESRSDAELVAKGAGVLVSLWRSVGARLPVVRGPWVRRSVGPLLLVLPQPSMLESLQRVILAMAWLQAIAAAYCLWRTASR